MSAERPRIEFDPYAEQAAVLDSDARFRVVAAGRRSGKTLLAAAETVRRALASDGDWFGWWFAPTYQIAETGFRLIDDAVPDALGTPKRSPPQAYEFHNGARLEFHVAGGSPNVSVGLDYITIDEAAKDVPERSWTQELRPTLSDTGGEAMFISTPDGRGWFHDWFHRGRSADYPNVESFQWTTYANPHVPDSEIDTAKTELPNRIFRQEYLAEFIDDTGGVFDVAGASAAYELPDTVTPLDDTTPPYRVAADLARSEDYLAIVSLDADGRVAHLTRQRDLSWPQIQDRIQRVADAHGPAPVAVDATRDNKVVADLEAAGYDIEAVKFSAQSKQRLIENLAAGMEAGEVTVPADTALATELSVFEYDVTRAGNVRYHAPDGHHDDTVDALAMAYDLPAGGSVMTARASFGGNDEEAGAPAPSEQTTVGDILPSPDQL